MWKTDPGLKMLDYGTTHDLMRDFEHSPRNTKDAWEMAGSFGVPFVMDEHVGVIDVGYPHFHEIFRDQTGSAWFGHDGGGGIRTSNPDVILSAATIACLLTPGYTYHMQLGLEGRVPGAAWPVQQDIAERLARVRMFIPPEAQLGQYRAPHLGGFPFAWTDADSLVGHAYASELGDVAWAVNPMPRAGFRFVAANGWRLDAIGPEPYIARFVR